MKKVIYSILLLLITTSCSYVSWEQQYIKPRWLCSTNTSFYNFQAVPPPFWYLDLVECFDCEWVEVDMRCNSEFMGLNDFDEQAIIPFVRMD